jgi:hypothetical protein
MRHGTTCVISGGEVDARISVFVIGRLQPPYAAERAFAAGLAPATSVGGDAPRLVG